MRYGFVIDQDQCIGCHACTVACKTEHEVPLGVNRTWVKYVETGSFPDTTRNFSVMRCNHCSDAPCVAICPTGALFKRGDGIVDFDTDICIGCKSCMQACPYDALYIDPDEHTAQKCNYCVHRVEVGIEPACVVVCPEQAIIAGDLDDPATKIARLVAGGSLSQRSVEQGTKPNLWYKGADHANLDPLGATHLGEGGGIWRDTEPGTSWLAVDLTPKSSSGPQAAPTIERSNGAPPRVTYNTDHPAPWGWRVSSYFLTKGIAAGIVIALAVLTLFGRELTTTWARWAAPLTAGIFLMATGALLVADLKRPDRFYYLLTKGNPGSWLVRGAWILSAYAALLGAWFLAGVFGFDAAIPVLVWIGVPLGLATAGYTAYLFAQAEARDLWQSKTMLWHMIAGAFACGGGISILASVVDGSDGDLAIHVGTMLVGVVGLGVIAAIEYSGEHHTANAKAGAHHMTRGRFAREWLLGGLALGVALPLVFGVVSLAIGDPVTAVIGGLAAMAGIWFADDALVKAGQAVPLS